MKIVTIARTLNEAHNIRTFCKQYGFSDLIILSDGGSTDGTIEIAKKIKGVKIIEDYHERIPMGSRYYTNEPKQINYLVQEAIGHGADWIIYDDLDCYPNRILKDNARDFIEEADSKSFGLIEIYRLYIYKKTQYFPQLNEAGHSQWAWNPKRVKVVCREENPEQPNWEQHWPSVARIYRLEHPFVLLHHFADTDEQIKYKMDWYEEKGTPILHPLESCGRLEVLPKYAHI